MSNKGIKMKKILLAFLIVTISGINFVAHSATPQSIAIIDSGINQTLFQGNIADQVCILEYSTCPNGLRSMDGAGAANTGIVTNPTLAHGTEMASIIHQVNPSAQLIPIKIVGTVSQNVPMIYSNNAVKLALDWVVANREKYNITAVNVSQGAIFAGCQVPAGTQADVETLKSFNVPVIAATGNNSNRNAMNSIACLPNVISVGATDNPAVMGGATYDPNAKPTIGLYSNGNALTNFYLNGRWRALEPNGNMQFNVGTSCSSAALTGWWTLNYKGNYSDTYNWLIGQSIPTSNNWLNGKYIKLPI
jgi:hypothetical protein